MLVTGADDHNGGVFEAEEGEPVGKERAPNLAMFLEQYLNELLSNKLASMINFVAPNSL